MKQILLILALLYTANCVITCSIIHPKTHEECLDADYDHSLFQGCCFGTDGTINYCYDLPIGMTIEEFKEKHPLLNIDCNMKTIFLKRGLLLLAAALILF